MAVLDEYILRAARLLSDAADEDVDALCREIMQVFDLDYTNPEALKYINSSSSFRYSKKRPRDDSPEAAPKSGKTQTTKRSVPHSAQL